MSLDDVRLLITTLEQFNCLPLTGSAGGFYRSRSVTTIALLALEVIIALLLSACGERERGVPVREQVSQVNTVLPNDGGVTTDTMLAAQPVEPTLTAIEPYNASPDAQLDGWARAADAIAVVSATTATPFLRDSADDTSISTIFTLEVELPIKGTAPSSAVQPGGRLANLRIATVDHAALKIGGSYVGFFKTGSQGGAATLVATVRLLPDDTFKVRSQSYSVAQLLSRYGDNVEGQ